MYKGKCVHYYLALILLLPASLALGATSAIPSASGLLLADPQSARPLALGNAFSALADDESAINTNPAGLIRARGLRISGGHLEGLAGTQAENLAAVFPLTPASALGLQVAYLRDEQQRLDEWGNYLGAFSNANLLAGIAWSGRLGRAFTLGLGAKGIHERYDSLERITAAADLGLQARFGPWLIGANASNLGLKVSGDEAALENEGSLAPAQLALSVGRQTFLPNWHTALQVTALPTGERVRLAGGSELWIGFPEAKGVRLALRAGYQWDLLVEDVGRLSLGAGIVAPPYVEVHYALVNFGLLGTTHRVSLVFTLPKLKAAGLPGHQLQAIYGLKVVEHIGGIELRWEDNNRAVKGYLVFTDYGLYEEQLTGKPVGGHGQKFIEVVRGQTYNFYVRPVGSDGKPGPTSEVLTWTAP